MRIPSGELVTTARSMSKLLVSSGILMALFWSNKKPRPLNLALSPVLQDTGSNPFAVVAIVVAVVYIVVDVDFCVEGCTE